MADLYLQFNYNSNVTDGDSNVWTDGDSYVVESVFTGTTSDSISGLSDSALEPIYQREIWRPGDITIDVPVTNGTYDVTLLFAESFYTSDGSRTFDVSVDGTLVADDLDIHAQVGHDTAYDVTYQTTVADGEVNVLLQRGADDNPAIKGMSIVEVSGGVTGTASGSIGNVTGSAASTLRGVDGAASESIGTVSGAAATTLRGVSATASGSVGYFVGSATVATGPTGTGAGNIGAIVGSAATLRGVTGALVGTVAVAGTAASTLRGTSGSATGLIGNVVGAASTVPAGTFFYTPPTSAGPRPLPYESLAELRRKGPRKLNPSVTMGLTVLLNGSTYTSTALPTTAEIKAADAVYQGGRTHTVNGAVKVAIEASGVGGTFEQVGA